MLHQVFFHVTFQVLFLLYHRDVLCVCNIFILKFFPVNLACSMFLTTTKSPWSIWGVYVVLFFPLMILDTIVANRPTTAFFASISYQEDVIWSFFTKFCHCARINTIIIFKVNFIILLQLHAFMIILLLPIWSLLRALNC